VREVDVQPGQDLGEVKLDGLDADVQLGGDLPVGLPGGGGLRHGELELPAQLGQFGSPAHERLVHGGVPLLVRTRITRNRGSS
jgi:hypothetical protein